MAAIKTKIKSESRIYKLIHQKRGEHKNLISKEAAANLIAADCGIDVYKILSAEELAELRDLRPSAIVEKPVRVLKGTSPKETIINFNKELSIKNPFLPSSIISDAVRMSRVYPMVYIFENSV